MGEERVIDDLDDSQPFALGYAELEGPGRFESTHQGSLDQANSSFGLVSPGAVNLVPKGGQSVSADARRRSGRILEPTVVGEQPEPALTVTGIERRLIALDGRAND